MIPMVGLIVAAYTVPRLLSMIIEATGPIGIATSVVIRIVSAIGLLATLFLAWSLVASGSHATP